MACPLITRVATPAARDGGLWGHAAGAVVSMAQRGKELRKGWRNTVRWCWWRRGGPVTHADATARMTSRRGGAWLSAEPTHASTWCRKGGQPPGRVGPRGLAGPTRQRPPVHTCGVWRNGPRVGWPSNQQACLPQPPFPFSLFVSLFFVYSHSN